MLSEFFCRSYWGPYLNAPAGNVKPESLRLAQHIVSEIGKKYGTGKGQNLAKGRRYIKKQIPNCCINHIKYMLDATKNSSFRKENDSEYIWRFQKDVYHEIFKFIVTYAEENKASLTANLKAEIKAVYASVIKPDNTYSELILRKPLIGLYDVALNGNTETKKKYATQIQSNVQKYDKLHKITI